MGPRSILAGLALAGVCAATPAGAEDVRANPDWLRKPRPEDLLAVWPIEALKRGQGGKAVIQCRLSTAGVLFDCKAISESPAGAGFGNAAIALTPQLLMKPATLNGVPVIAEGIRIPINFQSPGVATGSHLAGAGSTAPIMKKVISYVIWLEAPTYAQVLTAYPEKARAAGIGGRAVLNCTFKGDGRLSGCATITEEPKGYGVGAAARSLAPLFLGPANLPSGESLKGVGVQVPVTFEARALQAAQPVIGKPNWTALPQPADLKAVFPKAAVAAGVTTARSVVNCEVVAGGGLTDCKVVSEDPAGLGFGASTVALTASFRVGIWTAEGLPAVGGRVRIPVRYENPSQPAPAKP